MEISQTSGMTALAIGAESSPETMESTEKTFASHLEEHLAGANTDAENERPNRFAGDLAEIKDKGFMAYVWDLEKERIEEIRKEILDRMGLTEEDLATLSAEQRAMIEDIIDREIRIQLGASSMKKNDDPDHDDRPVEQILAAARPNLAFASMGTDQEKNTSISVINQTKTGNIFRSDAAGSDEDFPLL